MKSHNLLRTFFISTAAIAIAFVGAVGIGASDPNTGDWPMWGGTPDRNMVSKQKNLPLTWDIKSGKNVKWVSELGSQTYGNPVVAGGKVFVGTNNESPRDPKQTGDRCDAEPVEEAHAEQVRTALPEGNLALSESVWVPDERIVVLIDALPWTRVTFTGDQVPTGAQTTPFSAALKPGTYRLQLENGGLTSPLEQQITVRAPGGEGLSLAERTYRFTMPGFDPNQTATTLSGGR